MRSLAASAALVLAGASIASARAYQQTTAYDGDAFFNNFDFADSSEGDYWSRDQALANGLIKTVEADDASLFRIGVDAATPPPPAGPRPALRLASQDNVGDLVIVRFAHSPHRRCGAGFAFWIQGIDSAAVLVNAGTDVGGYAPGIHGNWPRDVDVATCAGFSSQISQDVCRIRDDEFSCRGSGRDIAGCSVYALQRTKSHIRLYSWPSKDAPSNVGSRQPNTETWGRPAIELQTGDCEALSDQFSRLKLRFEFGLCPPRDSMDPVCLETIAEGQCESYVRDNWEQFQSTNWGVQDIRFFEEADEETVEEPLTTTTSHASTTTTSHASTTTTTSHTSTTSTSPSGSCKSRSKSTLSTKPSSPATPTPSSTPAQQWTTSTFYTTTTYTVSSCAPSVTSCSDRGRVVTETRPVYTVCPVSTPAPTTTGAGGPETMTTKITTTYTVTSCSEAVADCTVGEETVAVLTSTYCPGGCQDRPLPSPSSSLVPGGETICDGVDCQVGDDDLLVDEVTEPGDDGFLGGLDDDNARGDLDDDNSRGDLGDDDRGGLDDDNSRGDLDDDDRGGLDDDDDRGGLDDDGFPVPQATSPGTALPVEPGAKPMGSGSARPGGQGGSGTSGPAPGVQVSGGASSRPTVIAAAGLVLAALVL